MDKELTRFKAGRLKFAAVATACLIGVLALPAIASAAAPFASQYPAPGATLRIKPAVIYVDVVQAGLNASTGKITVDGVAQATAVLKGTGAGSWSAVETLNPVTGLYQVKWTWTALAGPVKFTLRAAPTASAVTTATHTVVATIKNSAGVTLSDTWNYTIVDQPVVVVPPVAGFNNLTCTTASTCHIHGAGYATDNAMGPNCVGCHNGGYAPMHGLNPSATPIGTSHAALQSRLAANSSGCASCHGSDVTKVLAANWDGAGAVSEHKGCSCHAYGEAKPGIKACEDCHAKPTDPTAPYPYHVGVHLSLQGELAANSGGCTSCHGSNILNVATGEHKGCLCHTYHEATPDKLACEDCHAKPMDPTATHPYHVGAHTALEAGISGTKSAACTACHGTNLQDVSAGSMHIANEHDGCSCHEFGVATPSNTECVSCHKAADAPHGFTDGTTHKGGGWTAASGHNTTTFGEIGAKTKWDGSEGPIIKDSAGAVITQEWTLPTAAVFWSQASAKTGTETPPATANTTVGWNSIVTCEDCHTGLVALELAGPHGANTPAAFGIDPNYPDDWTQAELTSFDPTGMRSILTTAGSSNAYYSKPDTNTSNGYSPGDVPIKAICQKCHKLIAKGQGIPAQTRAGRSQQGFGWSNEVHMEHHGDQIRGQGNCVSCHVAIPHGWKRPRLLVYSTDIAPYRAPQPSNWFYGVVGTQYLDAINAAPAALKELELTSSATGYDGVVYPWDATTGGVKWLGDPAGVIDPENGEYPAQNNCNACSAAGNTHVDPTVEAIPTASPTWK